MRAAVLHSPKDISQRPLEICQVARPALQPGHVLLRVRACGVCRTDLHVVEGDLRPLCEKIIPGHQIVGEIVDQGTTDLPLGARVGVSWIGGIDESCWYCRHQLENLCDSPTFTGYGVDGGYAEFATARADFTFPLPAGLDDLQAAPLLCAGIIGFRSLRIADVKRGERVGLFGFGASAHLAIAGCMHGIAKSMSQRVAHRTGNWRIRWVQHGLEAKQKNLLWRLTGLSPSRPVEMWS